MNNILEKYREEFKSSENDAYLKSLCNVGANLLLDAIQAEYDKLCPKPCEFKESEYVAINPSNIAYGYLEKPKAIKREWNGSSYIRLGQIELPLGLDWRLCCWSLDDAKRIWGESDGAI